MHEVTMIYKTQIRETSRCARTSAILYEDERRTEKTLRGLQYPPEAAAKKFFLNRAQSLIQIVEQIVDVLNPDGDAHKPVGDADRLAPLHTQRGMRHGRRM